MSDEKKTLSQRIEDTVLGVLTFLVRFLRTFGYVAVMPHRASRILEAGDAGAAPFVQPFTFLVIGAFLFSLLIDVYPAGFAGLIDLIWFGDEIKESVRRRWKEALSLTTLITTGLPIVLATTGFAALYGRIVLREADAGLHWVAASCYAFGFLSAALFGLMSGDALAMAVLQLLPMSDAVRWDGLLGGWLALAPMFVVLAFALISPIIFLTSSDLALRPSTNRWSRFRRFALIIPYWLVGSYLLAESGSVLPNLSEQYFPEPTPQVMIFEEMVADRHPGTNTASVYFEIVVDNPTPKDVLLELGSLDATLVVSSGPDEPALQSWGFQRVELATQEELVGSNRVVVKRESFSLIQLRTTIDRFDAFYEESRALIAEREKLIIAGDLDESLPRLRLRYQPSFRMTSHRANHAERMIDMELFERSNTRARNEQRR